MELDHPEYRKMILLYSGLPPPSLDQWLEDSSVVLIIVNHSLRLTLLVGGFNPSEKHESKWIISPNRDENENYLKPPPRLISLIY